MMAIERVPTSRRLVNGGKKERPAPARKRKNPGAVLTLGLINPEERKEKMPQKKRKQHHKPAKKAARNPVRIVRAAGAVAHRPKKARNSRKKRNPQVISMAKSLVIDGGFALAGLAITRQLPQIALGSKNTDWKGYLANAGVALAASFAAGKFVSTRAGADVLIGGGLYLANRVLTEKLSPVGKYVALSGLANGDAAATGKMGTIAPNYSPIPVTLDNQGNPVPLDYLTRRIDGRIAAALPPAPAGGKMSGRLGLARRRLAPAILVRTDRSPELVGQ